MAESMKFEALTSTNYYTWKEKMQAALILQDLWSAIAEDAVYSALDAAQQEVMKLKAISLIKIKMSSELMHLISGASSAKAAWDGLETIFKAQSTGRKSVIRKQLKDLARAKGEDVLAYISRGEVLRSELRDACGEDMPEDAFVHYILDGLGAAYDDFVKQLRYGTDAISLASLKTRLFNVEPTVKNQDYSKRHSQPCAYQVTNSRKSSSRFRKSNAHSSRSNAQEQKSKVPDKYDRKSNPRKGACHICGEYGHWANECPMKGSKHNYKRTPPSSFMAQVVNRHQVPTHCPPIDSSTENMASSVPPFDENTRFVIDRTPAEVQFDIPEFAKTIFTGGDDDLHPPTKRTRFFDSMEIISMDTDDSGTDSHAKPVSLPTESVSVDSMDLDSYDSVCAVLKAVHVEKVVLPESSNDTASTDVACTFSADKLTDPLPTPYAQLQSELEVLKSEVSNLLLNQDTSKLKTERDDMEVALRHAQDTLNTLRNALRGATVLIRQLRNSNNRFLANALRDTVPIDGVWSPHDVIPPVLYDHEGKAYSIDMLPYGSLHARTVKPIQNNGYASHHDVICFMQLSQQLPKLCLETVAMPSTDFDTVQFVPDSGATNHLIHSRKYLSNFVVPVSQDQMVQGIGGKTLRVQGVGSLRLFDKMGRKLVLGNVLFVPDLVHCIVSVTQLAQLGFTCSFSKSSWQVVDPDEIMLFQTNMTSIFGTGFVNNAYSEKLQTKVEAVSTKCLLSLSDLHLRLGHASDAVITNTIKHDAVLGLSSVDLHPVQDPCLSCVRSKQTRCTHSTSSSRASSVLDLLHADLMGPLPKSIGGSQYVLVIVDDYSKFSCVECIEFKSDAVDALIMHILRLERITGANLKVIRTDGGREFVNDRFKHFCVDRGVQHQTTVRYTPEQNGRVERLNRELMEKTRAMLFHCGAPPKFWGEAIKTADRLRNLVLHAHDNKTPFELMYGVRPDLSRLHIFGCTAHVHVPKEKRRKLDARSETGMFVGYSTSAKAWRIALQNGPHITIVERDSVIFDEKKLGPLPCCSRDTRVDCVAGRASTYEPSGRVENTPEDTIGIDFNNMGEKTVRGMPQAPAAQNIVQNQHALDLPDLDDLSLPDLEADIANDFYDFLNPFVTESDNDGSGGDETIPEAPGENANVAQNPLYTEDDISDEGDNLQHADTEPEGGAEPTVRKSSRTIKAPDRLSPRPASKTYAHLAKTLTDDPQTLEEVKERSDWPQWKAAIETEIKALEEYGTFTPTTLPPGRKAIPCKWVFKVKRDEKGNILKYRARLVAKGFKQIAGKDFDEVFAPVSRHATFRMLLAMVTQQDMELHHMDIKTAFMNGDIQEDIYMQPPPGFKKTSLVWRLHKGVNGLKQAAKAWNDKLTLALRKLGFVPVQSDISLFSNTSARGKTYILCYVDDLLIAGNMSNVLRTKQLIAKTFKSEDMGEAKLFLGMNIVRDRQKKTLWLGQPHYTQEIIERAGQTGCRTRKTPMDINLSLSKESGEQSSNILDKYQELVGCLLYLTGCTRPDIAHAVGVLSRFMSAPTDVHMNAVHQVIKYLAGSVHLGIKYGDGSTELVGYCDADYAGDMDKRKSTSGNVFIVNGGAISWASKLQPTVAMSTCEAEFIAAANATKEALWLRQLLSEFTGLLKPTNLFVDNQGALKLINHPHSHQRTKHIDIAYRFTQDRVERGEIVCNYIETEKMVADCITKAVPLAKLLENVKDMGLEEFRNLK